MSNVNTKMTAIADAIRSKTGKTDALTLDQMASEVNSLELGIDTSDANATANDMRANKTAYANGKKITGNIETFDGSYECSDESTGGGSVEAWTGTITSEHLGREHEIYYTDDSLNHCTATVIGFRQDATITIAARTLIYVGYASDAFGDNFVRPIENDYSLLLPTANNFEIVVG